MPLSICSGDLFELCFVQAFHNSSVQLMVSSGLSVAFGATQVGYIFISSLNY